MARLNTRISATPQAERPSTVDSLYRDPTPLSQANGGSARLSSYSVMSPAQSMTSDKENELPDTREETPQPRGKGNPMASRRAQRPPTPNSGSTSSGNANKRRRTGDYNLTASGIYEDRDDSVQIQEDGAEEDQDEDRQHEQEAEEGLPTPEDEEEEGGSRYYNPQQPPEERRALRASFRNLQRDFADNHDELVKPGGADALVEKINASSRLMNKTRQTAEAGLDAQNLVTASHIANKQLNNILNDNADVGVNIDQFVSRLMYYMTNGRPSNADETAPTQTRDRRGTQFREDDGEDLEAIDESLDWAFLGRSACFPNNKRPPVSSFLLGPLSVQKRVRTVQARRARSQRQPLGPATRPQEIRHEDMNHSENSNLTTLVKGINKRLRQHITEGMTKIEEELEIMQDEQDGDNNPEAFSAACSRHRVFQTPNQEPAVSLFDFAINPDSFGQTVENLFYISFLIRENNARVLVDDDELPLLVPAEPRSIDEQRQQNVEKHQAIFSIDYRTWQMLKEAFDITKSLIPNRSPEKSDISAGGWYS